MARTTFGWKWIKLTLGQDIKTAWTPQKNWRENRLTELTGLSTVNIWGLSLRAQSWNVFCERKNILSHGWMLISESPNRNAAWNRDCHLVRGRWQISCLREIFLWGNLDMFKLNVIFPLLCIHLCLYKICYSIIYCSWYE